MRFRRLKELLTATLILTLLVERVGVNVCYDAFDVGLGSVLMQQG